jgi:outer membrane protein assembly factor BamE (lipoprotein component of BamABCDE complex)
MGIVMRISVLAAVAAVATAGCSQLTAENYAKVKVGMSYGEVTSILGAPASCDEAAGFRSCRWGDEKRHATVRFAGDKVVLHTATNIR